MIIGAGQQSAIITLVERHSRYLMMRRLPLDHTSLTVVAAIIEMICALCAHLQTSLTWDQGAEMANHAEFTVATDCGVFFCDRARRSSAAATRTPTGSSAGFCPRAPTSATSPTSTSPRSSGCSTPDGGKR